RRSRRRGRPTDDSSTGPASARATSRAYRARVVPPFVPSVPAGAGAQPVVVEDGPGASPSTPPTLPAPPAPAPAPSHASPRLPALGALAPFADDPAVTDLLLDGDGRLWRDAGAGLEPVPEAGRLDPLAARRVAV